MHFLITSEVRWLDIPEDKAAQVKILCINLLLRAICSELNANYQQTYRRWNALKDRLIWNDVGPPPLKTNNE